MSFVREAVRERPTSLHVVDSDIITDQSGQSSNAVVAGSPSLHPGLLHGASSSRVLDADDNIEVASSVFKAGAESRDFTLEAIVLPLVTDSNAIQILSHKQSYDGLAMTGNNIVFSVPFSNSTASVSYDILEKRRLHITATKTSQKISLFIDGVVVSQADLTEEQKQDSYSISNTSFQSGLTLGTGRIAVGALVTYDKALDGEFILRNFISGQIDNNFGDTVTSFGGERQVLARTNSSQVLSQGWLTEQDWRAAELLNVAVIDNKLVPVFDDGALVSGYWYDSVSLDSIDLPSIHSAYLDWDGRGMEIEVSINGTTWTTASKCMPISAFSGISPDDKEVYIRVSFVGGVSPSDSVLNSLSLFVFASSESPEVSGRTITFSNAYPQRDYSPTLFHELSGTRLDSGGSVTISSDTSDANESIKSIEVWIKPLAAVTISFSGTMYQNGVLNNNSLPLNQWSLVHVTSSTASNPDITISGNSQISQVSLFPNELSAPEIIKINNQYAKNNTFVVEGNSDISMPAADSNAIVYVYDWSIVASG